MPSQFANILGAFDVDRRFWVDLIGCSDRQFQDWWTGRRDVPFSAAETLSHAIGVDAEVFLRPAKQPFEPDRVLPPLWLKARQSGLDEPGHRAVAAARLLAARYEEVLSLVEPASANARVFINEIKAGVDPQRPARAQGELAAHTFVTLWTLGKGGWGIGEVIRGFLRARGVLVLETPINNRSLEGFCVPVGSGATTRPCIVANSYRTTWFRRNYVILHELAHAIFDLDAVNGIFDLSDATRTDFSNIAEQRADAFALHALLPKRLLIANRQRLKAATKESMAELVAETHAEQELIVRAAREYELVTDQDAEKLRDLRIARELRNRSYHARGLSSLRREDLIYPEVRDWGPRLTSFPLEGVRLPIPFVRAVGLAVADRKITSRKAAELLMIGEDELGRYGIDAQRAEEALVS
jgi:Zn-dependent peptidase ImmA (M78 family)